MGHSPALLPQDISQPPGIKVFFPEKLQEELFHRGGEKRGL